jgi:uncharacterized membrane protein YebE (DUF533 family)
MVDARRILDALVGASAKPGAAGTEQQRSFLEEAMQAFGQPGQAGFGTIGQVLGQAGEGLRDMARQANEATGGAGQKVDRALGEAAQQVTGGRSGAELAQKAKDFMDKNPGVAEAALMSLAGLLLGTRRGRGLATGVAGLGGLAVVSGLAYKAFQNYRAGKPLVDVTPPEGGGASASGTPAGAVSGRASTSTLPGPAAFDPASASEDDARLFVRAMVAAATADGQVDEAERRRIVSALSQAGVDAEAARWLEREFAAPATVDEIADPIRTPEKAAQVYAAARVAIDPDTMQEREFLRQLAEALDLDPQLRTHIDTAASGVKSAGP